MTITEYIKRTRETAVYPEDQASSYIALGLVDEISELRDKVMPYYHQKIKELKSKDGSYHSIYLSYNSPSRNYTYDKKRETLDEFGDMLWYLARLIDEYDVKVEEETIDHVLVTLSPSVVHGYINIDEAFKYAAEICGFTKKILRGDKNVDKKREQIKDRIRSILKLTPKICHHLGGFSVQSMMDKNYEKLTDRKKRNVLKGDGDHR